jgi:hypothetical protein
MSHTARCIRLRANVRTIIAAAKGTQIVRSGDYASLNGGFQGTMIQPHQALVVGMTRSTSTVGVSGACTVVLFYEGSDENTSGIGNGDFSKVSIVACEQGTTRILLSGDEQVTGFGIIGGDDPSWVAHIEDLSAAFTDKCTCGPLEPLP